MFGTIQGLPCLALAELLLSQLNKYKPFKSFYYKGLKNFTSGICTSWDPTSGGPPAQYIHYST